MKQDWKKELDYIVEEKRSAYEYAESAYNAEPCLKTARLKALMEREYEVAKAHNVAIGDKVSECIYTDWHSYTICSRTRDVLYARADRQLAFKKSFEDGERFCEEDPNAKPVRFTWSKLLQRWVRKGYTVIVGEYNYEDPSF